MADGAAPAPGEQMMMMEGAGEPPVPASAAVAGAAAAAVAAVAGSGEGVQDYSKMKLDEARSALPCARGERLFARRHLAVLSTEHAPPKHTLHPPHSGWSPNFLLLFLFSSFLAQSLAQEQEAAAQRQQTTAGGEAPGPR